MDRKTWIIDNLMPFVGDSPTATQQFALIAYMRDCFLFESLDALESIAVDFHHAVPRCLSEIHKDNPENVFRVTRAHHISLSHQLVELVQPKYKNKMACGFRILVKQTQSYSTYAPFHECIIRMAAEGVQMSEVVKVLKEFVVSNATKGGLSSYLHLRHAKPTWRGKVSIYRPFDEHIRKMSAKGLSLREATAQLALLGLKEVHLKSLTSYSYQHKKPIKWNSRKKRRK